MTRSVFARSTSDIAQVRPHIDENPDDDDNECGNVCLPAVLLANRQTTGKSLTGERTAILQSLNSTLNLATPTTEESDALGTSTNPISCVWEPHLINEFESNDLLISGAFPWLFIHGCKGVPFKGSPPLKWKQKILQHYSLRFAHCSSLIFLLCNQAQRHAACATVATRVRANPESIEIFCDTVTAPEFNSKLVDAIEDPEGQDAKEILEILLPHIDNNNKNPPQ